MPRGYRQRIREKSASRGRERRETRLEGARCESCHGAGQKHTESASAADIRNPAKLAAAAADKIVSHAT